MTATDERLAAATARSRPLRALYAGNARSVMQRGWSATRSTNWLVIVSGFFEPIFYLLSLGIGFGSLVGTIQTSSGQEVPYAAFIAPALLATAAMNGAVYDSTWNVFFKMHFAKLYEGMLATSLGPLDVALGEILLALLRGALYALGFMLVMQAGRLRLLEFKQDDRCNQFILIGKILVNGLLADSHGTCDVVHADAADAELHEQFFCFIENTLSLV